MIRSERYYGKVSRSFTLEQEADESGVQAQYTDGMLGLTLPKKSGTVSKKITVADPSLALLETLRLHAKILSRDGFKSPLLDGAGGTVRKRKKYLL